VKAAAGGGGRGMRLVTDAEQLAAALDSARSEAQSAFGSGELLLENDDRPLKPAGLEVLSPTEARVSVIEGRYHMVRRMFAAVGNHVEALHRERLGGLPLPDDLEPGQWRLLGPDEIDRIFA
jgi:16S rRNA pseudouridine516 synthase